MRTKIPVPGMIAVAALATILSACGDTPAQPESPLADSDLLTAASGANHVVLLAGGRGTITGPPGQDKFFFRATKRANGTVRGRVRFKSSFFGQALHGNVVCMARRQTINVGPPNPDFVPRDFVAIGTDVPSPDPENTGPYFVLSIIDGGEGPNALPDKMFPDFLPDFAYPQGPPDDAAASCESFELPDFLLDIGVVDSGYIKVRY